MPCLVDSASAISKALNQPIGFRTISEIIDFKGKPVDELTVCITVSDNTRSAPYIRGRRLAAAVACAHCGHRC